MSRRSPWGSEPGVVLLTHPLLEQGFDKTSIWQELRSSGHVCLHVLNGKNFG